MQKQFSKLKMYPRESVLFAVVIAIILISTFFVKNFVDSRSMDPVINRLLEGKLIEQKDVKKFEEMLPENAEKPKSSYIAGLYWLEHSKITGSGDFGYRYAYTSIRFGEEKPNKAAQEKVNKEMLDYLTNIYSIPLITQAQYEYQLNKIKNDDYVHLLQMLEDLTQRTSYEDWISPDKIIHYAEKLLSHGITDEVRAIQLKDDALNNKIKSHYQIIDYCRHAIFFDASKYSDDPSLYIEQIHKDVASLLPELKFSHFSYRIEIDSQESYSDYTAYKLIVSLESDGKKYKHKSFISPHILEKDGHNFGKIDGSTFYQIFNKILIDKNSSFRLHQIRQNFNMSSHDEYQYFGIIALEKDQVAMFRFTDSFLDLSYEEFHNTVTSSQIDDAVEKFQEIGLLDHLSPNQIAASLEKIKENYITDFNDILLFFPDVIYFFDLELSNLNDPYVELVKKYALLTRGEFSPIGISDDFNIEKNNKVTLKFTFNGNEHIKIFQINDDWIDIHFFEFMNRIADSENLKGRFYSLHEMGQGAKIIYLTPEQHHFLKAYHLLRFDGDEEVDMK